LVYLGIQHDQEKGEKLKVGEKIASGTPKNLQCLLFTGLL